MTLTADIMFVNNIRFLVTISRNIQFRTIEVITYENTSTLIQSLVNVISVYKKIRFRIFTLHVDGQFDTIHIQGAAAELNCTLNPVSGD